MANIATIHREEILDRISKGEYVKDIAIALGVTKQAISQVLKDDPEYTIASVGFISASASLVFQPPTGEGYDLTDET